MASFFACWKLSPFILLKVTCHLSFSWRYLTCNLNNFSVICRSPPVPENRNSKKSRGRRRGKNSYYQRLLCKKAEFSVNITKHTNCINIEEKHFRDSLWFTKLWKKIKTVENIVILKKSFLHASRKKPIKLHHTQKHPKNSMNKKTSTQTWTTQSDCSSDIPSSAYKKFKS